MRSALWFVSGAACTGLVLITSLLTSLVIAWRRRQRPVEKRRADGLKLPVSATNVPVWPAPGPLTCSGCGRNAGHDDGCSRLGFLGLAATRIDIPRTGQGES